MMLSLLRVIRPSAGMSRSFAKSVKNSPTPPVNLEAANESAKPRTIPVNYLKDGEDPVEKTNDHYPEWLRSLKLQNLTQLNNKGYDNLTLEEQARYWKLASRRKMKDNNYDSNIL